jgi:hypothetical protein
MSDINDGGPAFPYEHKEWDADDREWRTHFIHQGMTLRDYFIAHAPVEPQPWFEPAMPTPRPEMPPFPAVTDANRREVEYVREYADVMDLGEIRDADLRSYTEARRAARTAIGAWDREASMQRFVQWPAAWADAMLKARQA